MSDSVPKNALEQMMQAAECKGIGFHYTGSEWYSYEVNDGPPDLDMGVDEPFDTFLEALLDALGLNKTEKEKPEMNDMPENIPEHVSLVENLEDDELLPEIVNLMTHAEKVSSESGEGFHGVLLDQGYLERFEAIVNEYKKRNGLPLGPWSVVKDFRSKGGRAYFRDRAGRIAVCGHSGAAGPGDLGRDIQCLDFHRPLKSLRLQIPLYQLKHPNEASSLDTGDLEEINFLRNLWREECERQGIKTPLKPSAGPSTPESELVDRGG